ncbi:hypothetical protein C7T94_17555 [Pedobacter yulinensis]|uniref:Uncharacterized protein n=1 Tax=Pedobacter yulinensis TaxID=2126353 RepID=A0A2T3HHT1_9SPHI|nr:hypothetical protein [Pedobacter yulinensis]PST81992.1 hypothetical protein C7T94_17555 [Pedobacter yulinensis]
MKGEKEAMPGITAFEEPFRTLGTAAFGRDARSISTSVLELRKAAFKASLRPLADAAGYLIEQVKSTQRILLLARRQQRSADDPLLSLLLAELTVLAAYYTQLRQYLEIRDGKK